MGREDQICKWPYAIVDGRRMHVREAARGDRGVCPVCGAELIVREGEFRAKHWWHVNGCRCDAAWYEPKGPWHWYWQNQFPENWQEVVMERNGQRHVADVQIESGSVVEIQWSAISVEDIRQREEFYKHMLWIVGMNRVERDRKVRAAIEASPEHCILGRRFHLVCECDLPMSQKWFYCSRPVFFDFDGTWERPEGHGILYYLMPVKGVSEGWRYCMEVSREEFVAALRQGNTMQFFAEFKAVRDHHMREEEEARERQIIQMRREYIDRRNAQEEEERVQARPYFPYADNQRCAIEFANCRFHVPPRCAITLGWVDAYLIIKGLVEHDMGSFDFSMRAPYGRIAIHFSEMYSRDEYAKDQEKVMDKGLEADLLPYDDLCAYKDRIVACVDYLIKHDAGGVMLTFRRPYVFFRSGQKAWLWHRSEVAVWDLPERTQDYLVNVDLYSQRF